MNLRTTLTCLALTSFATVAFASNTNSFVLVNSKSGKTIGKANYSIGKSKNGFKIESHFEYHILSSDLPPTAQSTTTVVNGRAVSTDDAQIDEGQYSSSYRISDDGNFLSGFIQNAASLAMTNFEPNKSRTAISSSSVQAGILGLTHDIPLPKPEVYFAPDGDPSAIQALMTAVLTHPHPDATYLVFVPAGIASPQENLAYVTVQPVKDTRTGTLDGKTIALQRYIVNFHVGHADVYVDSDGNLMEANVAPLSLNYIRAHFALAP